MNNKQHYSSIFISDVHLGNIDCKADFLLEFLNNISCDRLFLVGDIIDLWAMHKQFRWPKKHNEIMHKIFMLSQGNTEVIYLPGNHDEPLQKYCGFDFSNIQIKRELIYKSASGKRYLVFHGDQCDGDVTLGKFHEWIGDKGYDLLLAVNRWYHLYKQRTNQEYWSLAGYIKSKIKGANMAILRYKKAAILRAKDRGLDGVICGHIHHPEFDLIDKIEYHNDGDWVENCTALAENEKGELVLLRYEDVVSNKNSVAFNVSSKAA